jgi:uncharacterized protein YjbJ (UPF0337 family)
MTVVTTDARRDDEQASPSQPHYPWPKDTTAWRVRERENAMSLADKAKNKIEELKGKNKEAAGRATGDNELKAEGKVDQVAAKLKQTGEKIKDAFK